MFLKIEFKTFISENFLSVTHKMIGLLKTIKIYPTKDKFLAFLKVCGDNNQASTKV